MGKHMTVWDATKLAVKELKDDRLLAVAERNGVRIAFSFYYNYSIKGTVYVDIVYSLLGWHSSGDYGLATTYVRAFNGRHIFKSPHNLQQSLQLQQELRQILKHQLNVISQRWECWLQIVDS